MIIDLILDRKDGQPYNARAFYNYASNDGEVGAAIADALDSGENEDVRRQLCAYIVEQEYNVDICDYINSVDWL